MKIYLIMIMWSMCALGCLDDIEPPLKTDYVVVDELPGDDCQESPEIPLQGYYARHNIVMIDSSGQLFYHNEYFSCGTGMEIGDPPRPINLKNGKFREMKSVDSLIQEIKFSDITPKLTVIAVDSDTIRNAAYFSMVRQLKEIDKCYIMKTRKMTKDEKEAVELKYWE